MESMEQCFDGGFICNGVVHESSLVDDDTPVDTYGYMIRGSGTGFGSVENNSNSGDTTRLIRMLMRRMEDLQNWVLLLGAVVIVQCCLMQRRT